MRITRLELENIKSYRKVSIAFPEGITAICGPNGAGKTTVLEAIGFALFGYSPYRSQEQFIREGENSGSIAVTFVSNLDEREYQVVRRLGTSPGHYVYDAELHFRVAEQTSDVSAWLKDHLGLDGTSDLENLFAKAIGVPQGLVTAHFLDTPGERKRHFDPILRVEEYKVAVERLRETVARIRELIATIKASAEALEREAGRRPVVEEERRVFLKQLEAARQRLAELEEERLRMEGQWALLDRQRQQLDLLNQEHGHLTIQADSLRAQWEKAKKDLAAAQAARAALESSENGHQAYLSAQQALERLERDRQTRDGWREQERQAVTDIRLIEQNLDNLQKQLEKIQQAETRQRELAPLAQRQEELERQRQAAQEAQQKLQRARERIDRGTERIQQRERELLELNQRVGVIEILRPVAERLPHLEARETSLRQEIELLKQQGQRLSALRNDESETESKLTGLRGELAELQQLIVSIQSQREVATRLPSLESRKTGLAGRLSTAATKLQEYRANKEYAADGKCPLLHEQCLNLGEGLSLAEYFDDLIRQTAAERATLEAQLGRVEQDLEAARSAETVVNTLPLREARLRQLQQEVTRFSERLSGLAAEIQGLEAGQASLAPTETEYQRVQAELGQAREASGKLGGLEGLYRHRETLQRDLDEQRALLAAAVEEEQALRETPLLLEQVSGELSALGDPRSDLRASQQFAAQRPEMEAARTEKEGDLGQLRVKKSEISQSLAVFAGLDHDLEKQRDALAANQEAHQTYLLNRTLSETVEDRAADEAGLSVQMEASAQRLSQLGGSLRAMEKEFDQALYEQIRRRREQINGEIGEVKADQRNCAERVTERDDELARLDETDKELRQAVERKNHLEELGRTVEFIRSTIKEAGPQVTRQLLQSISLQANGIFGQILGDYSMELSWQEDYGIMVRQGANDRAFAQLSGGEQMTAALAVRLALLKELSDIDVAFFDEPTQNMDEDRRTNLAQQITQVKGFSQLFVISHDDTFEQYTSNIIHIRKEDGESFATEDVESVND